MVPGHRAFRRVAIYSLAVALGWGGLGAGVLTAEAATPSTASPTPQVQTCSPYEEYVPTSWHASFATSAPEYTYTVRNGGGTWNTESFSVTSSQSYTASLTVSANISVDASVIVAGTTATTGVSVAASATKSTGYALTANLDTPPGYYAHFESGAWSEASDGNVYQVQYNCSQTYLGAVYSTNTPKTRDAGINDWYNTTA